MSDQIFGLIGHSLKHSFSKNYFDRKFKLENIKVAKYELFELQNIRDFVKLISQNDNIRGLNVTIPYKQEIIPYLDTLEASAQKVGAVNVIKISKESRLTGFNSDYFGFKESLKKWLPNNPAKYNALILGSGGASKAVRVVLEDLNIPYITVSRTESDDSLTYKNLNQDKKIYEVHSLIINTTPLGMYPNIAGVPDLQYDWINHNHFLYDLVYNPEMTEFLRCGKVRGASTKNGLEMLHLQAEKSWEIWNS